MQEKARKRKQKGVTRGGADDQAQPPVAGSLYYETEWVRVDFGVAGIHNIPRRVYDYIYQLWQENSALESRLVKRGHVIGRRGIEMPRVVAIADAPGAKLEDFARSESMEPLRRPKTRLRRRIRVRLARRDR